MHVARYAHVAAPLPDGRVLVAGGADENGVATASSEIYEPATGLWTMTEDLAGPRWYAKATALPNGQVLVTGGIDENHQDLATAEVFDPNTGKWTPTASMNIPRVQHEAVLLPTGKVLVFGGFQQNTAISLASAEVYDPDTANWTMVADMNAVRADFFSGVLGDGRVISAGGNPCCPYTALQSSEVFDPGSAAWTLTGDLVESLSQTKLTILADGSAFVAGGTTGVQPFSIVANSERFDPGTDTWSAGAPMSQARFTHTQTLLNDGRVLVAGGRDVNETPVTSSEVYDPASDSWESAGEMSTPRYLATATRLLDGRVLVAGGGISFLQGTTSAEIYSTVSDGDGDGVPDGVDVCPNSDLDPTVVIGSIDTKAGNDVLADGCTVQDLIDEAAASATYHGEFVGSVVNIVQDLRHGGVLTLHEGVAIIAAAVKSKTADRAVYSALLDYEAGWSAGKNPNGVWRYGWSTSLKGPLTLFTRHHVPPVDNGLQHMWDDPDPANNEGFAPHVARNSGGDHDDGNAAFAAGVLKLHPGAGGTYAHVVFTAPSHGQYTVAATFYAQQYGINAEVKVLVNGKVKFSDTLTDLGESHSYAQDFSLKAGQTVDFIVGPNGQPELHPANTGLEAIVANSNAHG
jgi:N-acetylneuraminic acid mutarotase